MRALTDTEVLAPMPAYDTLPQARLARKSPVPKSGVLTLGGFGITARVQRGHLELQDRRWSGSPDYETSPSGTRTEAPRGNWVRRNDFSSGP